MMTYPLPLPELITSPQGIDLIKQFESLRLKAYQDGAGVWTIGYGTTYLINGQAVNADDKLIAAADAEYLLKHDVKKIEAFLKSLITVDLNQHQFDALVSLVYNIGEGNFKRSSLLKFLNAGNYPAAAKSFLLWNKVTLPKTQKKVVSKGLANRRLKEMNLFLKIKL